MKEMIKKIIEYRGHAFINALMAIGIIPYTLSLLGGTIISIGFLDFNVRLIIAYGIPAILMIILVIFRLCNPLTIAIGHAFLLLFSYIAKNYNAFHYSMPMIIITLIVAILYYIFGYAEKNFFENIVLTTIAIFIIIIWYSFYKML